MIYNLERPTNFDQVVGQELIVENLRNQSKAGSFFPVLILCGQYGSGKTTLALIVAMAANCEYKDADGNPCGKCESCLAVLNHAPEGVIEIDGATNNGVDHIRRLLEQASTMNVYKKKVIIIDEAHMMSKAAFNAMLVTLENPPDHCIFIICTTEVEALPPTITSRMPVYTFGKIPDALIKEHILRVADKNRIFISTDAAGLISRYANGAMRNALQILEQLSKQKAVDETIKAEDVVLTLGLSSVEQQAAFLTACLSGDLKTVIEVLKTCEGKGIFLRTFLKDVLRMNTDLLLVKTGAEVIGTDFYLSCLKSLCKCESSDIVRASRLLTAAVTGYGQMSVERVATEIAASFYEQVHTQELRTQPGNNAQISMARETGKKEEPKEEVLTEIHTTKKEDRIKSDRGEDDQGFRPATSVDEVPFEGAVEKQEPVENLHSSSLFSSLFSGFGCISKPKQPAQDLNEKEAPAEGGEDFVEEPALEPISITGAMENVGTKDSVKEMEKEVVGAHGQEEKQEEAKKGMDSVPPHNMPRESWMDMAKKGILPEHVSIPVPDPEEELDALYEEDERRREEAEEKACTGSFQDLEKARKRLDELLANPGFKMLYSKGRKEEKDYHIYLYYNKVGFVQAMEMFLDGIEGITALMEE